MLGRDESKHISCGYIGHEKDCPVTCSKCAIPFKKKGDAALSMFRVDEAIRYYKRAVFITSKYAEAWYSLGTAYGQKNEFNNALIAFNKAILIDPAYGNALWGRAVALNKLGKKDKAMETVNAILELYDDSDTKQLKISLINEGVKDRKQVIDNEQAEDLLLTKALELMRDNNLLGVDGSAEIIAEIYQPEAFTRKVLEYCKNKYRSLGEKKVRGECLITSFYGSICAVMLHQKDPTGTASGNLFEYLERHIDVEFTDVNAERLLGTKAGEEKAEKIWEMFSPYVSYGQFVFANVDELNDDIMLEAMKHAYAFGMLVAQSHLKNEDMSEKRNKHQIGTRKEIDQALKELADSSEDHKAPPPKSAMCYSLRS